MSDSDPLARWRENPFFLLGLEPTASDLELEREGRKLIAQLELGVSSVRIVRTPLGPIERSVEGVRSALARLRDPRERRLHALWARLPPLESDGVADTQAGSPWTSVMEAIGWPGL